jgi:hypothetical protein
MSPEQAREAVREGLRARARTAVAHQPPHAEGRVIGYSQAPQILIETDDGQRLWWRADLSDLTNPTPDADQGADEQQEAS